MNNDRYSKSTKKRNAGDILRLSAQNFFLNSDSKNNNKYEVKNITKIALFGKSEEGSLKATYDSEDKNINNSKISKIPDNSLNRIKTTDVLKDFISEDDSINTTLIIENNLNKSIQRNNSSLNISKNNYGDNQNNNNINNNGVKPAIINNQKTNNPFYIFSQRTNENIKHNYNFNDNNKNNNNVNINYRDKYFNPYNHMNDLSIKNINNNTSMNHNNISLIFREYQNKHF